MIADDCGSSSKTINRNAASSAMKMTMLVESFRSRMAEPVRLMMPSNAGNTVHMQSLDSPNKWEVQGSSNSVQLPQKWEGSSSNMLQIPYTKSKSQKRIERHILFKQNQQFLNTQHDLVHLVQVLRSEPCTYIDLSCMLDLSNKSMSFLWYFPISIYIVCLNLIKSNLSYLMDPFYRI